MSTSSESTATFSLLDAVRDEVTRVFRPPYETPLVVAVNGAMMSSAWFLLPTKIRDQVFTIHGSLAFALILASWMYSDVPATNVLGSDAARASAALGDARRLRRLLVVKNIVLWLLVTPVCLVVALLSGLFSHDLLSVLYSVIWIGVVPFGVLAVSAWVGILWPYHPMPLRYRWEHRRPHRRMLWRWGILVLTPYGLVPFLGGLLMVPSLLLWGFTSKHGLSRKLPDRDLGWGVLLACGVAVSTWAAGLHLGVRLAQRRSQKLLAFLGDPTRG